MFEFRRIDRDDPLMDEIYRLRYQVYVTEWEFERPEDHPGEMERDIYDPHSVHFAAIRKDSGQMIGTIRLVLDSSLGLPLEKHCILDANLFGAQRMKMAEFSRLAVSKDYRRRATDSLLYAGQEMTEVVAQQVASERRKADNDLVVGLYRSAYREGVRNSVDYVMAVMARGLFVLLKRIGIDFKPAGPEIDYHGLRTPYMRKTRELVQRMAAINPEWYALFMTD